MQELKGLPLGVSEGMAVQGSGRRGSQASRGRGRRWQILSPCQGLEASKVLNLETPNPTPEPPKARNPKPLNPRPRNP